MLRISEIFESCMGEGVLIGTPSAFIRLNGCNLYKYGGCKWCDTKYAQREDEGELMTEEQIATIVESYGHKWITITGGEPLAQDLQPLLVKLRHNEGLKKGVWFLNDRRIQLETNCTLNPIQYSLVSRIALSPKLDSSGMAEYMNYEYMKVLNPGDEVKFIIASEEDFSKAIGLLKGYPTKASVIFTPVDGVDGKWIVDKILEMHIENIRVLCQMHKVFNLR